MCGRNKPDDSTFGRRLASFGRGHELLAGDVILACSSATSSGLSCRCRISGSCSQHHRSNLVPSACSDQKRSLSSLGVLARHAERHTGILDRFRRVWPERACRMTERKPVRDRDKRLHQVRPGPLPTGSCETRSPCGVGLWRSPAGSAYRAGGEDRLAFNGIHGGSPSNTSLAPSQS